MQSFAAELHAFVTISGNERRLTFGKLAFRDVKAGKPSSRTSKDEIALPTGLQRRTRLAVRSARAKASDFRPCRRVRAAASTIALRSARFCKGRQPLDWLGERGASSRCRASRRAASAAKRDTRTVRQHSIPFALMHLAAFVSKIRALATENPAVVPSTRHFVAIEQNLRGGVPSYCI